MTRARALIMAGGRGVRLRPYTDDTPKPMLPVGGQPLLERLVVQLHHAGIEEVHIALGWLGEVIEAHMGTRVAYVREEDPLGTIGALSLLPPTRDPTVVVNGDVLSPDLDFQDLVRWHEASKVTATIATRPHSTPISWGVATLDPEGLVIDIREKPTIHHRTLAGIYVVGYDAPPPDGKEDAPYYLRDLAHSGMRVNTYPVNGRWVDIGSPETYQQAQEMMGDG